jgi:hypothetical protein
MPASSLKADLAALNKLAHHRRKWSEADLRRYHKLLKSRGSRTLRWLEPLRDWMLAPISIWPIHIQDVFRAAIDALENDMPVDPSSSKLQTTYSEKGIEVRRAIPVTSTFPANPVQDTDSGIVVRRAIPVSITPVDRISKNTSNGYNTKSISPHPKGVSLSLFILPSFIFGIGLFSGFFQRKK